MNDTLAAAAALAETTVTPHAFAWVLPDASAGPIAIPLQELTQEHWNRLVEQLPRETRRRMRRALEGLS